MTASKNNCVGCVHWNMNHKICNVYKVIPADCKAYIDIIDHEAIKKLNMSIRDYVKSNT
jgi:hypothetical protein